MKETLEMIDHVRLNFSPTGLLILNITIAFVMFGVALDIKWVNFKTLFLRPKSLITGYISQIILLPAVTFLLILLINPTPTIALGMILVASCPGGNISNFLSSLSKGNVELSVSLTAITTMTATFMTPANFALWGEWYINFYNKAGSGQLLRPIEIDFYQMLQTVFILLGIPIILGLLCARYFPGFTQKLKKPVKQLSIIIFLAMVIILLSANFTNFLSFIHVVFIIVLLHNGLALTTGYTFSSLMKRNPKDRRTIAIETGIQNSGLALVLIFNPKIFPAELELGGMAIVAAWWGVWHIISGLALATLWSRRQQPQPAV